MPTVRSLYIHHPHGHTHTHSHHTHNLIKKVAMAMATLIPPSSTLFTSTSPSSISVLSPSSLPSIPQLLYSLSSSLSVSHSFLNQIITSPRMKSSTSVFVSSSVAVEKKKVLIVNTNSGGHHVIGFFYFAKELLGSDHEATALTVADDASDKMKKPPFSRFTEITAAGGKTVCGDPAAVGQVIGDAAFDAVLDNNGKDLDSVMDDVVFNNAYYARVGAWRSYHQRVE